MSSNRKFKGVTPQAGSEKNKWRGQIVLGGKVEYLHSWPTAEEAAKAYDNASFYAAKTGRCRRVKLNFPEAYAHEPYPPPTERTLKLVADLETRVPNRLKTCAQIRHFPDRELLRDMVQRLAAARRAELGARSVVDGLLAQLQGRLSVDSKTVEQEVAFMQQLEKNQQRLEPSQAAELRRLQEIYRPEVCNAATSLEPRSTAALS